MAYCPRSTFHAGKSKVKVVNVFPSLCNVDSKKKPFSLSKRRDHFRGAKRFFSEGFKVLKPSASTFALLEINQFYGRLGGADFDRRLFDFNKTPLR